MEDGHVLWYGRFRNPIQLGGELLSSSTYKGLLIEFNQDLAPVRHTSPIGFGPNGFTAAAQDPSNNGLILAGECTSNFQFGSETLLSNQSNNCFIAFLDEQWEPVRLLKVAGHHNIQGQYAAIADIDASAGPVHALSFVGEATSIHDGSVVGTGALLTRIDRVGDVSIGSEEAGPLRLWPNPVETTLFIKLDDATSGHARLEVLAIDGRMVLHDQPAIAAGLTLVDCSHLQAGQYLLRVMDDRHSRTVPFARQ